MVTRRLGKRTRSAGGGGDRLGDIDLVVFDIDGVLTDGSFLMSESGQEWKRLVYRDLDALTQAQAAGNRVALLTAEQGPMVDRIAERLSIKRVVQGAKDKLEGLQTLASTEGVPLSRICFVGDAERDVPALRAVGVGLVPSDAALAARRAAKAVLRKAGGTGVAAEALAWLARRQTRTRTSR